MSSPPRVLVLGGTRFVGRTVVDAALSAGWQVTALHRGRSPLPLPEAVQHVHGDRTAEGTLAQLVRDTPQGWDAVVDTWSGDPWVVRDAAHALSDHGRHYVYISSRSVYLDARSGATEAWPVIPGDPDATGAPYPEAKAGAERAVTDVFGTQATILRPGVILGPHEDVGRLPWWLRRAARGGPMLAPGPGQTCIQYVDVRDLAEFAVRTMTGRMGGPFDVVCPAGRITMDDLLRTCLQVTESSAVLHWVDPQGILDAGIEPWTQLPLWLPPGPDHDSIYDSDVSRALGAGLQCRPLADSVGDTWAWLRTRNPHDEHASATGRPALGMSEATEQRLLAR